jgi:hypothetical protein
MLTRHGRAVSPVHPFLSISRIFGTPGRPHTRRPQLEALEDRVLLNTRFVVPAGAAINDQTTFASLQGALTAPGLAAGDVVQIQAGSTPGNIANADLPALQNLTIQGDPAAGPLGTPRFDVTDPLVIGANRAGFRLQGVNVALTGGGSLTFNANASIADSSVTNVSSSAVAAVTLNGTADVLSGSTFSNDSPLPIHTALVLVTPASGSSNRVVGNTFTANASVDDLLAYQAGAAATVTDQVSSNTFAGTAGSNVGVMLFVGAQITGAASAPLAGLSVQGNTFTDPDTDVTAVEVNQPGPITAVSQNQINLTAATVLNRGIVIVAGGPGTTSTGFVSANHVNTAGSGTGLEIDLDAASNSVVNLRVEGNDFHSNRTGVTVVAPAGSAAPLAGIDLGGGSQGSLGGNNFSSFHGAGFNAGAIVLSNVSAAEGTLKAQRNIFVAGVSPATVITDANANVDAGNVLTGNAAFVAALYDNVLRRAGNTTSPTDAGGFINALNAHPPTTTPPTVAGEVIRSQEGLELLVDGLYLDLLNRRSDPSGQAGFVGSLQHGGTFEQVIERIVASPEYTAHFGGDAAFVQSLYEKLFGRPGSSSELAPWLSLLETPADQGGLTRAMVANDFVMSSEFRGDVVEQMYGFTTQPPASVASLLPDLLNRSSPPSAAEVAGWVHSGLDVLSIEAAIAGGGEFIGGGGGVQATAPVGLAPLDRHAAVAPSLTGEGFSTIPPTGPAELNPYGVAFAPANFPTSGTLQPGDLLVANFNDPANLQGTGTTIVRITPEGQRSTFFTSTTQLGLDAGLAVLKSGFVIVANVPNVANNPGQGSLQVIDSNGNLVTTITDPNLLDGPWDFTVNDQGATAQVFVSNVSKGVSASAAPNGTVTRIDLSISGGTVMVTSKVQIASGYATRTDPAAFVVGPAGLAFDPGTGTLYVASEAEKINGTEAGTIFAIANAGTTTTDNGKGTVVFADLNHLHGPLGMILLPNGDLMAANNDSVNIDPNQPSELVEFTPAGRFVNQFSIDPLIDGPFSLAVTSNGGQVRFAYLNDNQNTVTVLNSVPTFGNPYVLSTIPPTGPAELNPYGVAFAPANFPTSGTLQPGDLLVANFNDPANLQGTGTTIVRITPEGQRSTFFTSTTQLGLDTGLAVLKSGFVIVANVPNVANNPGQGSLQVIDSNGNLVTTISDPNLLDGPWDLAVNDQGSKVQVFVSNVSKGVSASAAPNGTVTRVDLTISGGTVTVQDMVQIASGYATRTDAAAFVVGPGGLAYDPRTDTLYVASQVEKVGSVEVGSIFAVANASLTSGDHGKGTLVYADTAHLHGPIGLVLLPNGDLMAANSDAVNTDPNQPSELVEFTTAGQFVGQFSVDPLNAGAFGVAVTDGGGQFRLAAVNDNQNTVSTWSFQTGEPFPAGSGGQNLGF